MIRTLDEAGVHYELIPHLPGVANAAEFAAAAGIPPERVFKTLAVACHESLAPCALPPPRRLDVGAAARALAWPSARVAPWAPSAGPDLCGRPNPRTAEPAPPGSADIG